MSDEPAPNWKESAATEVALWRACTIAVITTKRELHEAVAQDHAERRRRASYATVHATERFQEALSAWHTKAQTVILATGSIDALLVDCYWEDDDGDMNRISVERQHPSVRCKHLVVNIALSASPREGRPATS